MLDRFDTSGEVSCNFRRLDIIPDSGICHAVWGNWLGTIDRKRKRGINWSIGCAQKRDWKIGKGKVLARTVRVQTAQVNIGKHRVTHEKKI